MKCAIKAEFLEYLNKSGVYAAANQNLSAYICTLSFKNRVYGL